MAAICVACAAEKELPLARCGRCGLAPVGPDRARSVIASTRMLTEPELREVQKRILGGEPFRPSRARIEAAGRVLAGQAAAEPVNLTRNQAVALAVGNLLLTPALGLAVWFGLRQRPGLGARQALWLTLPVSLGLFGAWALLLAYHRAG